LSLERFFPVVSVELELDELEFMLGVSLGGVVLVAAAELSFSGPCSVVRLLTIGAAVSVSVLGGDCADVSVDDGLVDEEPELVMPEVPVVDVPWSLVFAELLIPSFEAMSLAMR
jgi:uncharacterized protein YceK